MINVFIIGSKGIPARYGGFETFVENLTKRKANGDIQYFVSCMGQKAERIYNNAFCFSLPTPFPGPVGRIFHVSNALSWAESRIANEKGDDKNIIYILGCRIGPLLKRHVRKLHKLHCFVVCNPDGLEWKRGKWNYFERRILKFCEKELVLNSDYIICDSVGIKDYLAREYSKINKAKMSYIAYGCDLDPLRCSSEKYSQWEKEHRVSSAGFYLFVGRFVPENNLFLIISEFMKSSTKKDLIIITNVEKDKYYGRLEKSLRFDRDSRIKFIGTIYDQGLLFSIREKAFAYIHGHSVGGTNPSLLEALGHTKINLLFDVPFNREVGGDQVLYFTSKTGDLSQQIELLEATTPTFHPEVIVKERFSWPFIVRQYETFFVNLP